MFFIYFLGGIWAPLPRTQAHGRIGQTDWMDRTDGSVKSPQGAAQGVLLGARMLAEGVSPVLFGWLFEVMRGSGAKKLDVISWAPLIE